MLSMFEKQESVMAESLREHQEYLMRVIEEKNRKIVE